MKKSLVLHTAATREADQLLGIYLAPNPIMPLKITGEGIKENHVS